MLQGAGVMVHSSLRSFGQVEGGAAAVVAALRENGNNANTLERQLRSTVTLGQRPITRGWFIWLLIWLAVLALLGAGYFMWGAKDALLK